MLNLHPKNESRFSRKLESLFWWILRLFPLIIYLLYLCCLFFSKPLMSSIVENSSNLPVPLFDYIINISSFETIFLVLGLSSDSIVVSTFHRIFFQADGILPFISNYGFLFYFSYLVFIEIARLLLDIILFIPKLARKWINMACQED